MIFFLENESFVNHDSLNESYKIQIEDLRPRL